MTALTDRNSRARTPESSVPAQPGRPVRVTLADPWLQLAIGVAGLLVTVLPVRTDRVGRREGHLFGVVNGLPDAIYVPTWMIMQLGTLGAAPAAAAAAWAAGDRRLAWRLATGGTATWALAKFVKRGVRRPRPASLLTGTICRGRAASGLGYLSGHAGVVTALGAAAFEQAGPAGRAAIVAAVPLVGLSRVYVGAHLPLDIAGGAALGLAVDAAVTLAQRAVLRCAPDSPHDGAGPPRAAVRDLDS